MNFFIFLLLSITSSLFGSSEKLNSRELGLLWGSSFGDALGGPREFKNPRRHKLLKQKGALTSLQWKELEGSLRLEDYSFKKSVYGPWVDMAPAGSVTDDTRHKMILWPVVKKVIGKPPLYRKLKARGLAKAYKSSIKSKHFSKYVKLWPTEYLKVANWILGERKMALARPPESLWGGMSTNYGQMALLPLAIVASGEMSEAYKLSYSLGKMDNGPAKDMNSALVGALSYYLTTKDLDFSKFDEVILGVDPYGYSSVPFVKRRLAEYLSYTNWYVSQAKGSPRKLFELLEKYIKAKTWWEDEVCFVVSVSFLKMAGKYPLAALALARDFGHDTDSYAQLIGAFLGALYGVEVFPKDELAKVKIEMSKQYRFDWDL